MTKRFMVTGSAGYIGSHMIKYLEQRYQGCKIDVIDMNSIQDPINLCDSHSLFDKFGFIQREYDAVFHMAANSEVGAGVLSPFSYMHNNITSTMNLLKFFTEGRHTTKSIILSSTSAVYKNRKHGYEFIEDDELQSSGMNAYPLSKIVCEQLLTSAYIQYGIKTTILRYGNVAGRGFDLKEDHDPETHLIPKLMYKKYDGKFVIFGVGGDIRDYIHVLDVCEANCAAFETQQEHMSIFNISSNIGTNVNEIIDICNEELNKRKLEKIKYRYGDIRNGDVDSIILDNSKAQHNINWSPTYTIEEIIQTM